MKQIGANVCSLQHTAKGMQIDGISTGVGSVGGKLLFTLNSHSGNMASLQECVSSATEQCQNSILRYRMYCTVGPWCGSITQRKSLPNPTDSSQPSRPVMPASSLEALQHNRAAEDHWRSIRKLKTLNSSQNTVTEQEAEMHAQKEDVALLNMLCNQAFESQEEAMEFSEADRIHTAVRRLKYKIAAGPRSSTNPRTVR